MADEKATACKVGGHDVVFKGKVSKGAKLTIKDIATINGQAPKTLPRAVETFLTGVAGGAK